MIRDDAVFNDKDLTDIYALYYDVINLTIKLSANTGVFKDYKREKTLRAIIKTALKNFVGYEEPVKSEGYKFDHWEDAAGNKYELTHMFGTESDGKEIELRAIYVDDKDNVVGKGGSEDGGPKANYTVFTEIDPQKSSTSSASFEVKKDGLVKQAMKDYKAYDATKEAEGWWQKGWSFENNLAT